MNLEIMKGALFGAIAGVLIIFLFRKPKKANLQIEEKIITDQAEVKATEKKPLMDRWSVKLALLGVALGILVTLARGYTQIGFMIGFAIPMSLILGGVGLVIDFLRDRKK
jgi:hypothetical protein